MNTNLFSEAVKIVLYILGVVLLRHSGASWEAVIGVCLIANL